MPMELFRFFDQKTGRLVSIRDDGTVNHKSIADRDFRRVAQKKAEVPMEQWVAAKQAKYDALPEWTKKVKRLPSMASLEKWSNDGVCMTPTGHKVEPDGHGPDGVPSWLLLLHFI